jgi:hypothetical protein
MADISEESTASNFRTQDYGKYATRKKLVGCIKMEGVHSLEIFVKFY